MAHPYHRGVQDASDRRAEPEKPARRLRLDLAYLGTFFEGWQVQDAVRDGGGTPRTVQGTLEGALFRIHGLPLRVHAASRTDSGVRPWEMIPGYCRK